MDLSEVYEMYLSGELDQNELTTISLICYKIKKKENSIKVTNKNLEEFLKFGRDRTNLAIRGLEQKKIISIKQQRDKDGKFDFNIIKVITDKVKF